MAAPCPAWLKEQWIRWLGPEKVWELYSGAENPGRTVIDGHEWLAHPGSVGRVQPGARLAVFDENGAQCGPHQIGEIGFQPLVEHHTFQYIGAEPRMIGDYFVLGDLGYLDEDGYLYIVDRRTDMILSGGVNVYPAEIEGALDSHPGVECSVVIGLPDPDLGNRVHAIVQLSPGEHGKVSEHALQAFLSQVLVRYKVPRTFEFVTGPLKDGAGKVRRSALREERTTRA
jgi:bile acid-coenzyme A ligase